MLRREGLREYLAGALWVLPALASAVAMLAGLAMSQVRVGPNSVLAPLAFQGTADDARALLTAVSTTVVTVIALVLGLTVVALQLSSTQFSPRLLRNFLRDRATQLVLSVFLATFAYSAAGLYTVGVSAGSRIEDYPRLAVSGSIVLLFASMAMVLYFADHLAHSIQIDAITEKVQRAVLRVIQDRNSLLGTSEESARQPPRWAVPLVGRRSGYVQTVHPELLVPLAAQHGVTICLRRRVGEHQVGGTTLAWAWRPTSRDQAPDPGTFEQALDRAVRVGFERTLEQDAAFGIRQLVDVACKALSPAVNDPYTAIQAVDHLSVIFSALAERPLGAAIIRDAQGRAVVIVPARGFGDYLSTMCGLIRRYGSREPTVSLALLRLLESCGALVRAGGVRWSAIDREAELILLNAEREVAQPADLMAVRDATATLRQFISDRRLSAAKPTAPN